MSSPAQPLGSWVRIPLGACMSLCDSSVFVVPPVQGVLPIVYNIHNFGVNSEWELTRQLNPSQQKKGGGGGGFKVKKKK
jgi:hypothetical protein